MKILTLSLLILFTFNVSAQIEIEDLELTGKAYVLNGVMTVLKPSLKIDGSLYRVNMYEADSFCAHYEKKLAYWSLETIKYENEPSHININDQGGINIITTEDGDQVVGVIACK